MDKYQWFIKQLGTDLPKNIYWITSLFVKHISITYTPKVDNYCIYVKDNKFTYLVDGEEHTIKGDVSKTFLNSKDKIKLTKETFGTLKVPIDTTVGLALCNYIIVGLGASWVTGYVNKPFNVSSFVDDYINPLIPTGKITADISKNLCKASTYIRELAAVVTVTATERNVSEPAGKDKFKNSIRGKYDLTKQSDIIAYDNELKEFDKAWLKDDPTYGHLVNSKTLARRKTMKLSFGSQATFDGPSEYIDEALSDKMPTDASSVESQNNVSRAGSESRGAKTQIAGTIFKIISQATSGLGTVEGDCGTTGTIRIWLDDTNREQYSTGYHVVKGKVAPIVNFKGKGYINIRDAMYCKQPSPNYCSACVGTALSKSKDSIPLASGILSSKLLGYYMSLMHGRETKLKAIPDIVAVFR